jgi:hypothetical protein
MQLAAPQRAHPPPVPPRPSRQVVAEALKKSPRPPCPTRQAPPPPNQRPWRLEEQQRQRPRESPGGGRTIVYDSAHLGRPAKPAEERRRPAPRDLSKLGQVAARTSNGTAGTQLLRGDNRAEEPTSQLPRKSGSPTAATKAPEAKDEEDERNGLRAPEVKGGSASDVREEECKRKKPHNVTFKDEDADEDDVGDQEDEREDVGGNDDVDATGNKVVDNGKEVVVEVRATEEVAEVGQPLGGKDKSSVPGVCATVVVIEEAEGARPAASQDERDNIRRQDWLEAGVRYSSTKITLPGEEALLVNGCARQELAQQRRSAERGPAERREEDAEATLEGEVENQLEFGDLDFSRYGDKPR